MCHLPFLQIVSHEGGLHGVYCIFHMLVFLYNPLLKVLVENNGSRDILCGFSSLDHLPLRSTNIANFCQLWLRGRAVSLNVARPTAVAVTFVGFGVVFIGSVDIFHDTPCLIG